jgi:hypothetical protein
VTFAALCPKCDRHFTDLAKHHSQPCAPVAILEIEPVDPPEFSFERWVEVFWSRVDRRGPDDCWPWRNALDSGGYGVIGIPKPYRGTVPCSRGGLARAHRVAYALTNGSFAPNSVIRHRCNNRPCCNPAHLALGNQGENANDVAVTNRAKHGKADAAWLEEALEERP